MTCELIPKTYASKWYIPLYEEIGVDLFLEAIFLAGAFLTGTFLAGAFFAGAFFAGDTKGREV